MVSLLTRIGCCIALLLGTLGTASLSSLRPAPEPAGEPADHAPPWDVLSPAAMQADVQAMMETFEAVHPDLYHRTSRRAVRARTAAVLASLDTTLDVRTFYVRAARLAAAFGDGHTRVDFPRDAYVRAVRAGAATFPYRVHHVDGRLVVAHSCAPDASLSRGTEVVRINGRRVPVLFEQMQQVLSGAPTYTQAVAAERFPYLLWAHGIDAPYEVTYAQVEPNGLRRLQTMMTMGIGFGRVQACLSPSRRPAFSFERRNGVGILTLRRLANPRQFRSVLRRISARLDRTPVDGLIIDLRGNEGGRTRVAALMIAALTDDPVRLNARKEWKVSAPFKEYLRRLGPSDALTPYLEHRNGRIVTIRYDAEPLPDVPLRYRGPVAVLVGPRTFSSAVTLASTLRTYNLAAVFGTETGGRVNRFGDGYPFTLSRTGLNALVSSARLVQASGDRDVTTGLRPDVLVPEAPDWGTDFTMGVALGWMEDAAGDGVKNKTARN